MPERGRPRWLARLAALLLIALFAGLAIWQVQRAEEKRGLIRRLENGAGPVLTGLPAAPALPGQAFGRVRLEGRFVGARQVLLDNRIHDGRTGFDVLTPLRLDDGRVVLVDRGWIAADAARDPVRSIGPLPGRRVTVQGRIWLPSAGIGLGPAVVTPDDGPPRATRIEYGPLAEAVGLVLEPAVIRATGSAGWLYETRDLRPHFGPMRHYGYAFQWFALALTVLLVTVLIEWRRKRTGTR